MPIGNIVLLGGFALAAMLVAQLAGRSRSAALGKAGRPNVPTGGSPTTARFAELTDIADLERVLEQSDEEPVWIFQHDPYCPISRAAWQEVAQYDGTIKLVDVSRRHDLTRAIAARTGVRHESPQVLLVQHRQAVWNASHFGITAAAMAQATSRSAAPSPHGQGPGDKSPG